MSSQRVQAARNGSLVLGEERRRSQRVLLRVRATLHFDVQGKPTSVAVTTLSVNNHGALLVSPRNIPASSQMVLEHGFTRQKVGCKVSRTPREMPEGFHVPVEFDPPAPGFWQIDFPPPDWKPSDDV